MRKLFFLLFVLSTTLLVNAQEQDTTLKQYAGKYKFPEGSVVTETNISVQEGKLWAKSAMGETELKKTDQADVFEIVAYGGVATFKRTEGKLSGVVVLEVGSIVLEGVKEEEKGNAGLYNQLFISRINSSTTAAFRGVVLTIGYRP